MNKISFFLVPKLLEEHIVKTFKAKFMFTDALLLGVETNEHSENILAFALVPDHKVLCSGLRRLSFVSGVISEVDLPGCFVNDIVDNLGGERVVSVK